MNRRESIKALLDGKKITSSSWVEGRYIYMDDEGLIKKDRGNTTVDMNCLFYEFSIFEEPKPKKKITFTRPKWAKFYERLNTCPEWMSTKEAWLNLHANPITSDEWETMEIEVDE